MTNEHDDAMLTAYAVGELDGDDRAAVEARLADDPAARAEVDEIRQVADLLESELQAAAAPRLAALQRTAIEAAPAARRPWLPIAAGLAAAAAILVVAGIFIFRPKDTGDPPALPGGEKGSRSVAGGAGGQVPHGTPDPVGTNDLGDRVALKISLPAPMFKGTPKPIKGEPNMGPARKGKRPPFFAPKGTVNLADGKPVTPRADHRGTQVRHRRREGRRRRVLRRAGPGQAVAQDRPSNRSHDLRGYHLALPPAGAGLP